MSNPERKKTSEEVFANKDNKPRKEFLPLGQRIKTIRTDIAKVSRDEICTLFGVTRSSLQLYEDGMREPKALFLTALAEHYGVSIEWLLTGRGDRSQTPISSLQTQTSQPAAEYSVTAPFDLKVLQAAIEVVEEGLPPSRFTIPADKRAAIIAACYDILIEDEEDNGVLGKKEKAILKLLKFAA